MKEEIVSGKSDRLAIRKSAAHRMNEAGKRLMTYGSWDGSKKQLLSWMRDNLDVIRLATFESPEEQAAFKKKLDENTLAKWSGCYTPWMGWGNETPTAVRKR